MASSAPDVPGKARKRAVRACRFCRSRKIKCNSESPICANCKTYGKECTYESIDQDAAPAPRHRRKRVIPGQGRTPVRSASGISPIEADAAAAQPGDAIPLHPVAQAVTGSQKVSRMLVSANGVSSYHGRTSALFEEPGIDRPATDHPTKPRMPDEWIERGLIAEATKQRQLEEVNFQAGKLDFDGVDPELGLHLLSLHWNRQHHSFLITYRPAFMRDMACGGPYFSKLLLNSIYFGASKFSPRCEVRRDPNDVRTAGWRFRQRVRELLGESLDRSDITTIQALLVMTNSLFALGDERSAAWLYAGLAFRMIVDLGIHVDASDLASMRRLSDEDLEIRRRVFWGAFVVDKIQSLYQGRPVSLKESDTLVPIKLLDTYEELEPWKPFAYSTLSDSYKSSPAYSVSTFTALCKLSVTMSDILSSIYAERSFDQPPEELLEMQQKLHDKLIAWRESLPSHLMFDPSQGESATPPPHVLSLHAMYHVLLILLHRPFVADGHLYNVSRSISVNSFMTCATAAAEIVHLLRAYHSAFSVRRAPYLISYATYVAATIHVRICSKSGPQSEAYSNLETCLAVFHENQETNWAVRRATAIVQNLMNRFGISMLDSRHLQICSRLRRTEGLARRVPVRGGNHMTRSTIGTPSSDQQAEGHPYSDTESLDIDGIIQSFAKAQDASTINPEGYYAHMNTQEPEPNSLPETHQSTSFSYANIQDSVGRQYGQNMVANFSEVASSGWQVGLDNEEASVDDLLFGFNSSALDKFPMWRWDAH